MRVLVNQQFHAGHHYHYIAKLLPALTDVVKEVVVAVTPQGLASAEFRTRLAGFAPDVRFEPVLPDADPSLPMNERLTLHRQLRAAVRQIDPDYVLIPSGDGQATAMSLFRLSGRGTVPGRVPCEVGIHFGSGAGAVGWRTKLRDRLNALNLGLSGLARIHVINLLFYEHLRFDPVTRGRVNLMPHPVTRPAGLSKQESRRKLGIPENGRYIGLAASFDSRKAVAEFIAAFRAAKPAGNERILLTGWMNHTHLKTIEANDDLVQTGQLVVMPGFADQYRFDTTLSALDVVCLPYPGFGGLSSTLLEGIAAGRPVLANAFGWCRAIVRRFGLGWTCDVMNPGQFASAIRTAFDRADEYSPAESVSRLLEFHSPENFGRTWVQGLRRKARLADDPPRSWQWVEEALSPAVQRLV